MNVMGRLARRFVAGETIDAAVAAVRRLNDQGMTATLDFLGEDVRDRETALAIRETYARIHDAIATSGVKTNLSVKLSALGMLIDESFAEENLRAICTRAADLPDPFVRIDMEQSAHVDRTLRIFERLFTSGQRNVGPVLQAYLRRTAADVERMIALGARVRLCKGAYREARSVAYRETATIRTEYLRLAQTLLDRGTYPGLATHDRGLIESLATFAQTHAIAPERFEFQMLYGVHPELQRRLVARSYRLRIYVPFGTHWTGYFYRRITERPENALFALRSILSR